MGKPRRRSQGPRRKPRRAEGVTATADARPRWVVWIQDRLGDVWYFLFPARDWVKRVWPNRLVFSRNKATTPCPTTGSETAPGQGIKLSRTRQRGEPQQDGEAPSGACCSLAARPCWWRLLDRLNRRPR